MKSKVEIPLLQIVYLTILFVLIVLRIIFDNLSSYINLANYISMIVSILSVWSSVIFKSIDGRKKNICKTIFILVLLFFVGSFVCILALNIDIPPILNDIFTLIALSFCICNVIFECLIKKIFSLTYR